MKIIYRIFLSVQSSPWYEIIFATEVMLSMGTMMVTTSYMVGLPFFYIFMICGLLKTVRHRLENLEKTVRYGKISRHEFKMSFVKIIKFHNEVMR